MKQDSFDVIVVGGGHAGVEAAHAASRVGARVGLVTLSFDGIGVMSCNPAIGGLGKGHLVREIDALDGLMGRVTDRAGIQFRLLNRRKGPAVQGPRAQADRALYRRAMQNEMSESGAIEIIIGEAADFVQKGNVIAGVILSDGTTIASKTVVLTTGTFLRGVIHIGQKSHAGGRMGDAPSVRLAERIDSFGLPLGRLKTGTPPRLKSQSINWDALESQPGDSEPVMFSFLSSKPHASQVACGITHTNEKTHEIIQKNLDQSAMYGGQIDGVGPRYCPSIEDKVVRFSDKTSHQIFLEPEGLTSDLVYPNGISTSLPKDVQHAYVRSIAGLESAEIAQPGYAIEYDYVDPRALDYRLSVKALQGLYFAGQINGTTGYEEAAGQGLVAGLNAAREAKGREPPRFGRESSYIGVMIDDLITRGVTEPYRMFTSRAEYRLSLRADNADQRLTPVGIELGCVGRARQDNFEQKMERLDKARVALEEITVTSAKARAAGIDVAEGSQPRTAYELLSLADVSFDPLVEIDGSLAEIDIGTQEQLKRDALYAYYIERQKRDVEALRKDEALQIPEGFDFDDLTGLSNELRQKLRNVRPLTIGHAGRIEGMTPAGLTLILAKLRKDRRKQA